jgi:cation transport ATPase
MGKHALRKDMTCLNCQHVVEKRFCPNCGQENRQTKESFHYLFTHFFEDLTHYDGSFWVTIKYLLFSPAKLTKEYLSGKRQSYVPPVRLYIFISFVTFFLLSTIPISSNDKEGTAINITRKENKGKNVQMSSKTVIGDFNSVAAYDSYQKTLPEKERAAGLSLWAGRKIASINEHNTREEFMEKFIESIFHNLPKVIFLFMPVFAFTIWLFHNKKRWYYYEHGIFTLHYFSMILLSFMLFIILTWSLSLGFIEKNINTNTIFSLAFVTMFFWWVFYFFRSHSRFYQERKLISRIKCSFIFMINFVFMTVFLILLLAYSALNVN